jgi:hypothetical protein
MQCGIGKTFLHALYTTFHTWFLSGFGSFAQAVSEEKIFVKIDQPEGRIACGGHVC